MQRDPLNEAPAIEDPTEGLLGRVGPSKKEEPKKEPKRSTFWSKIKKIITFGFSN